MPLRVAEMALQRALRIGAPTVGGDQGGRILPGASARVFFKVTPMARAPIAPLSAFVNGRVLTMAPGAGRSEVVVVRGETIAAVGGRELLGRFPGAEVHDLAGATLCPGFIDAHHHLCISALQPRWADLRGVADLEGLARALTAQSRREPDAPWIRGAGWSEIGTGFAPHRRDLDALGLDRPVLVAHYSLHQGVCDSRALDELGIGPTSPDPEGGSIERDPDGALNGLLIERAWSAAHHLSLAPYDDPDRWAEHIRAAAHLLLTDGITAVHDTACPPEAESAYAALARDRALPISVLACPHPADLLGPLEPSRLSGAPSGHGDEWFRIGPMKLFADGGVSPAIDVHLQGSRLSFGTIFEGLAEQVGAAVDRDFRVAVHAIGNAGLDVALDAFDAANSARPGVDHRFRVEHACLASAAQLERLARLDGVAVVQPAFLHHLGGQVEGVKFDDAEWLAFATMQRTGVRLAASSDCPCTFHEPLRGAHHGARRLTSSGAVLDASESVSFADWLRAYTAGAAYAGGQESERGAIAPGLRADLVVLDGDLDAEAPPVVAETWVAGRPVYQRRGLAP